MALNDIDIYYVKCIGALHCTEHILKKEPSLLQLNLEEAIKAKTGVSKDFGPLIACLYSRPVDEIRTVVHGMEDIKTASSSDNELELDLFNEDLMCIICNGMDVAAGNQLIECSDCHSLYHQECHRPPVMTVDSEGTFTCQNCKDIAKSLKKTITASSTSSSHMVTSSVANIKAVKSSPPQLKPPTSTSVPNYKSSGVSKSSSNPVSKSSKSSLKSASSSSGSSKSVITPTINIISADKRLQIMKKKAAKLHEKKKHLTR